MVCQAFASSFLPSLSLGAGFASEITNKQAIPVHPSLSMCSQKPSLSNSPLLAAAFAALACFSVRPPMPVRAMQYETDTTAPLYISPGLHIEGTDTTHEGTLLRVLPEPQQERHSLSAPQSPNLSSPSSATNYQGQVNTIPDWAAVGVRRTIYPHRNPRLSSIRPATIGLVSVSAVTSGSVLFRSVTRKRIRNVHKSTLEDQDVCSVVSIHIPFCVPERATMMKKLEELAAIAIILTPEGMAEATRSAANLLLDEARLLEDSRKFAPKVDVFLAENMACAEKRFAGHVEIEAHRIDRVKNCAQKNSTKSSGEYGVVTLVVATTAGVDLACYNEDATIICRLRGALDRISRLQSGQVAGLELQWVPESEEKRSLNRAQLCEVFPGLKVV
ncbi:hypothetical protein BWQ96_01545 [Gracilariopsis chorda]|uniref:Uncharacterized protein n=1 Tax=Gracilariopsis chorda TaxID=448386 RepID=A0A2V3J2Y2_9FLOR|nr:hypothetical protein BWQ96_01545 [Gracilariopsis chorda]|eukprot:PXF48693.1 hypothetical protein BWQ96_01545 [Gracilariopsis chorda]